MRHINENINIESLAKISSSIIKSNGICINNIALIYGKENLSYLLENTVKLRKKIITNSKTEEWLIKYRGLEHLSGAPLVN